MPPHHIHQALAQIEELRKAILGNARFTGFSGWARITGGLLCPLAAFLFQSSAFPKSPTAQAFGWGGVCLLAIAINAGALAWWFLFDPASGRDVRKLVPAADFLAPVLVGGVLSLSLILHSAHDLLFGVWMCMYGLVNLVSRRSVPKAMIFVGCFYLCAGADCLLLPGVRIGNPWPMALVFLLGEIAGGVILIIDKGKRL